MTSRSKGTGPWLRLLSLTWKVGGSSLFGSGSSNCSVLERSARQLPPSTSCFGEPEDTDGVHRSVPHQCPLGLVATTSATLCWRSHIPMTHRNDRYEPPCTLKGEPQYYDTYWCVWSTLMCACYCFVITVSFSPFLFLFSPLSVTLSSEFLFFLSRKEGLQD